jgi:hypothetical protein
MTKSKLMEKRHNYKKLHIWKMGIAIADEVFGLMDELPKPRTFP